MNKKIQLLDMVALAQDLPEHGLVRGEIGTVVECYPDDDYDVEFVARDGYTYALITVNSATLVPLRQKQAHTEAAVPFAM